MPLIALEGLGKRYRIGEVAVDAVRNVSLTIGSGEAVAIMGPSGSGKSTLLGILGCLDRATSGSYHLAGYDVAGLPPNKLAALRCQRIGFVFQGFNLLPRLNALENVELPLAYADVPQKLRRDMAAATLERVGLSDRIFHRPNQLSGGQQQRVAIARALVNAPDLILADEPTGALDSVTGSEILRILKETNEAGRTALVVVTHDQSVAAQLGRQIHIRDGRIDSDLVDANVDRVGTAGLLQCYPGSMR